MGWIGARRSGTRTDEELWAVMSSGEPESSGPIQATVLDPLLSDAPVAGKSAGRKFLIPTLCAGLTASVIIAGIWLTTNMTPSQTTPTRGAAESAQALPPPSPTGPLPEKLRKKALAGANLSGRDLSGMNLKRADLRETDLTSAILTRAQLDKVPLRGANLPRAVVSGSTLQDAELRTPRLSGAELRGMVFRGADLSDAEIRATNFSFHTPSSRARN